MSVPALPVKVEVGLKAEFSGKIPDKQMGRLGDAIADVLSPFTEGLGLIGDAIRVQRAKRFALNVKNAQQILEEKHIPIFPPPVKFISSWAEGASLEEDNSELNKMWSSLLANAGGAYQDRYLGYVELLRSMSGDEARLLNNICRYGDISPQYELDRSWLTHVRSELKSILEELPISITPSSAPSSHASIADLSSIFSHDWKNPRIVLQFSYPGIMAQQDNSFTFQTGATMYHYRPGVPEDIYCHKSLVRKGLAYEADTEVDISRFGIDTTVKVWFFQATEIGIDLVKTCSGVTESTIARSAEVNN